jgi:hypothetical protein
VLLELQRYQSGAVSAPPTLARSLRVLFERLGATYIKVSTLINLE